MSFDDNGYCDYCSDDGPDDDCLRYFIDGRYNADDRTVLIFNVEMTRAVLQLATALLHNAGSVETCHDILKAAWSLRRFTGAIQPPESDEVRDWNRRYDLGQQVVCWPNGRNGAGSFLTVTGSPAFDTNEGPVILVDDHPDAVSLFDVQPRSVNFPEGRAVR